MTIICTTCALQYQSDVAQDVTKHRKLHYNFLAARQLYPWLCNNHQYISLKMSSDPIMNDQTRAYTDRLDAAENLLRAYFSDNLCLYEYKTHFFSFNDFAAMFIKANRNRFPSGILRSLITHHGERDGIEPGKSYYRVPV